MATILELFKNIGSAPVQWALGEYLQGANKAVIVGSSNASWVSGGLGAETITIDVGAGGVLVSSLGTEASAADWVNTINGTPGLAGVASVTGHGGIMLVAPSYVAVTNYGGSGGGTPAFKVIGIPWITMDSTLGTVTSIDAPETPSIENLSSALTIPDNANTVTIAAKVTVNAADAAENGVVLMVIATWEFSGGEGAPPYGPNDANQPWLGVYAVMPESLVSESPGGTAPYTGDPGITYSFQNLRTGKHKFEYATFTQPTWLEYYSIPIPPGATKMRVAFFSIGTAASSNPGQKRPPTISSATAYWAAR